MNSQFQSLLYNRIKSLVFQKRNKKALTKTIRPKKRKSRIKKKDKDNKITSVIDRIEKYQLYKSSKNESFSKAKRKSHKER